MSLNLPKEPVSLAPGQSIYITGNKSSTARTEEELRKAGWVFPNGTPPEMLKPVEKPAPIPINQKPTQGTLDISKLSPQAIKELKAAGWVFPDSLPTN